MKENKFRAWHKKQNKFIDSFLITNELVFNFVGTQILANITNDVIITEYSTLKDDNKNNIYESDILFCKNRKYTKKYFEVTFEDGCFMVNNLPLYQFIQMNDVEVAGNIFKNSDLLK